MLLGELGLALEEGGVKKQVFKVREKTFDSWVAMADLALHQLDRVLFRCLTL